MNSTWTYKYADIDAATLSILQQELVTVWMDYTSTKNYDTCRFIFLLVDQQVRKKCPNLINELTRLGVEDILEGIGFLVVPPGCYTPLHIDNGVTTTLSIPVLNCDRSYTVWYKDPEPLAQDPDLDCIGQDTLLNAESAATELIEYLRDAQVPYFKIDPDRELDRVESNRAIWLNASIPHRPEVLHNDLRVLATLRFYKLPEIIP